jgi:hypothetical protein
MTGKVISLFKDAFAHHKLVPEPEPEEASPLTDEQVADFMVLANALDTSSGEDMAEVISDIKRTVRRWPG